METQRIIKTMTLQECALKLRALGVKTSETRIGDAIEQGVYPFGVCIKIKNKQNRVFEIYEKLFADWVNERAQVFVEEGQNDRA